MSKEISSKNLSALDQSLINFDEYVYLFKLCLNDITDVGFNNFNNTLLDFVFDNLNVVCSDLHTLDDCIRTGTDF